MPIAHGDKTFSVAVRRKRGFQGSRLALGEQANRRVPPDGVIVMAHDARAGSRYVSRQRTPREPSAEKIDDVGIAEQVVEKRFHGVGRIGPAQLEQHHADFFLSGHLNICLHAME